MYVRNMLNILYQGFAIMVCIGYIVVRSDDFKFRANYHGFIQKIKF